jgi:Dyp-type peroxidase family
MADLDLADIQGFILRGYNMPAVRYFVLRIDSPSAAGEFLSDFVNGDPSSVPRITTAMPWDVKPEACVNIGFTFTGLQALGLSATSLASFPKEFKEGAAVRARVLGGTGESAPNNWQGNLNTTQAHVLLSVFAQGDDVVERLSGVLRPLFARQGAVTELATFDGHALPDGRVHFGYRDGIAQPRIEGDPPDDYLDGQPAAPAGEFLFGYPSQWRDFSYPVPSPADLGRNGSFGVFGILQQDVDAFEKFLQENALAVGMTEEQLAAKICGRWRNGVPLALSPDTDSPQPPIPPEQLNNFDYVPSATDPQRYDDRRGYRCPLGSHIRRANPRGSSVAGGTGHKRRLVRRGLPYGPPYDRANPGDGVDRGLLGLFICVSILDQFEFLMTEWLNNGDFAGLDHSKDALVGSNTPEESQFVIPIKGGPPTRLMGFSRFVTNRGTAYCFFPSITALKYLANLAR